MAHYVVIPDDPDDDIELLHDTTCGAHFDSYAGHIFYDCQEEFEVANNGITSFFDHIDNKEEHYYYSADAEFLLPGKYEVRAWSNNWNHWEYGPQYESGLELINPER